jgi:hypothetical protein
MNTWIQKAQRTLNIKKIFIKIHCNWLAPMVHTCNPCYWRNRDQDDRGSKPVPCQARQIVLKTLSRKYPKQKENKEG